MCRIAKVIFALILVGIGISGYLAYIHYSGKDAACPLQPRFDCNAVLNSGYSTVVGIPVSVFGLFVYLLMIAGLIVHEKKESVLNDKVLLVLPAIGVVAGGFYTALMFFRLGVVCIWCEANHLNMLLIFILMARHIRPHWNYRKIFSAWIALFIIGSAGILLISSGPDDNAEISALAKCLSSKNISMYGAYWCPHCLEQKRVFGNAFSKINYIECADTANPKIQLDICSKAGIEGYPTWDFNGKKVSGMRDLKTLSKLSECEFN